MSKYLLSVHSDQCEDPHTPSPEEAEASMARVMTLEADMRAAGSFLFGGALTPPDVATVVRSTVADGMVMTDGPYAEAKEHIGGFYIVEAADLDEALVWAAKVVEAIGAPIEVRPFVDMPTH